MHDYYRYQLIRIRNRLDEFGIQSIFLGTVLYVLLLTIFSDFLIPAFLSVFISVAAFRLLVSRSIRRSIRKADSAYERSRVKELAKEPILDNLSPKTPKEIEPQREPLSRNIVPFKKPEKDHESG